MNLSLNEMVMVAAAMIAYKPRHQVHKDQKEAIIKKLREEIQKEMKSVQI